MNQEINRKNSRVIRHERLRRRLSGTAARPRMALMVSNRHMYVQFVDDVRQVTLAAVSTAGKDAGNPTVDKARALGRESASAAKAAGIERVVVDRGGFKYHGRIKALVEGAAEAGLKIRGDTRPEPDAAEMAQAKEAT